MMDPENYIRQNAPTVAENCICFLLWYDMSFQDTLARSEDHIRKFGYYCNPSDFSCEVRKILAKASESEQSLRKFVNSRRELLVKPYRRTYLEYIRTEWDTELPLSKIISRIQQELGG